MVFAGTPGRELAVTDGVVPGQPAAPIAKGSYTLKQSTLHTATLVRSDLASAIPVPPRLPYDQLSATNRPPSKAGSRRWPRATNRPIHSRARRTFTGRQQTSSA